LGELFSKIVILLNLLSRDIKEQQSLNSCIQKQEVERKMNSKITIPIIIVISVIITATATYSINFEQP